MKPHERLKQIREKLGYSQEKMAALLDLPDLTRSTITNYETGRTKIPAETFEKLLRIGRAKNLPYALVVIK